MQELLLERARTALRVGLGYLGLDRQVRTLSGGEAQRIQLATALGGALTASLYVLDEPSIGLHARDVGRLLGSSAGSAIAATRSSWSSTRPRSSARRTISSTSAPARAVAAGESSPRATVAEVAAHAQSPTGRALRGELGFEPRKRRRARGALRIVGATERNLKDVTVDVPLGQLVAVTGVSGAGKSTLIRSVLVGGLRGDPERGACARIEGAGAIGEVVVVEPTPPRRSLRSNPGHRVEGVRGHPPPVRRDARGARARRRTGAGSRSTSRAGAARSAKGPARP